MKKVFLLFVSALFLQGCASIINGTRQDIGISSNPRGSTVESDAGLQCVTPCTLELLRRRSHTILIDKEGYEPASAVVTHSASGWLWGNVFFGGIGGIIGLVIDFASGGAYKLKPETIHMDLKSKSDNSKPTSEKTNKFPKIQFVSPTERRWYDK